MSEGAQFRLDGKLAIVTGALGLLGRKHCEALARAGATVVATDLNEGACEDFAAGLHGGAAPALGIGADVTDPDQVARLRERVLRERGAIDVLVNNAAINDRVESPMSALEASRFERFPPALFARVLEVAVTGTFLCSQAVIEHMIARRSGSIVNIASTYALVGPDQSLYRGPDGEQRFFKSPAYPTAKGAIVAFTRFLAAYVGEHGVRVNTLSPGGVQNGQDPCFVERYASRTPLRRMAHANDYQGALVFLASDASAYMTGANLVVDGGFTAW
jgi:NAD(P)-dependent dehydrogenase (short-subunit alcohol dehydrogenase family)